MGKQKIEKGLSTMQSRVWDQNAKVGGKKRRGGRKKPSQQVSSTVQIERGNTGKKRKDHCSYPSY